MPFPITTTRQSASRAAYAREAANLLWPMTSTVFVDELRAMRREAPPEGCLNGAVLIYVDNKIRSWLLETKRNSIDHAFLSNDGEVLNTANDEEMLYQQCMLLW